MIKVIKWDVTGEVAPEELRKRFEEEKRRPGNPLTLYEGFFDDVTPYMVKAILKTNAYPMTKAQAIYYFGRLAGAVSSLANIYWFASSLEEDVLKEIKEEVGRHLQKAVGDVIVFYSDIKEGKPLDDVMFLVTWNVGDLEFDAVNFCTKLAIHITRNCIQKPKPS
jgi:hypothetical protein